MTRTAKLVLVTGGARSGKSALAERLVTRYRLPKVYIATAEAGDAEMSLRIQKHRDSRGDGWHTIEEPLALAEVLRQTDGTGVRLVDCLTLWLSNSFGRADIDNLCMTLGQQQSPVVLVTNELGLGIVPDNALAREFRDQHGWMNQAIAGMCDEVWMAVAGQPFRLKPNMDDPDASV